MTPVLTIKNLKVWLSTSKCYTKAIDGFNLHINSQELYALVGESGCGKSMTANAIMGLLPANGSFVEGSEIIFEDIDLLSLTEKQMRKFRGDKISMVFQEPMSALNPVMKIGDQLKELINKKSPINKRQEIIDLLKAVKIPDPELKLNSYPHELSGGMKQRVLIAMALASRPKLLIADEPTTALDVTVQAEILSLLKSLQVKYQMSILFITHDLAVVSKIADRIGVMYAGQIVEEAYTEDFFNQPFHPYSKKLIQAIPNVENKGQLLQVIKGYVPHLDNILPGCRFSMRCENYQKKCEQTQILKKYKNRLIRCCLWESIKVQLDKVVYPCKKTNENEKDEDIILKVENLKVYFPIKKGFFKRTFSYVKAVDNISFSVTRGSVLAVVGESGCGKTSLAKAILQLIKPSSGKITFNNQNLLNINKKELNQIRKNLQIIFQDPYSSMNPKMLIKNILTEGIIVQNIIKDKKLLPELLKQLLEKVGMDERALLKYPHEFSGGQRQRIAIARALSVNPELIICDEPTSALDVSIQAQILNLLVDLQKRNKLTYIFISHDLAVVSHLADIIMVMYHGKIVEIGKADDILNNPQHHYTKELLCSAPTIG